MTITESPSAPLVAVVGATGIQGGSVVRALTESDKAYRVRGFTRDASKPAARDLEQLGVEVHVVSFVVDNQKEAYKAFAEADYAFLVTNFWEHMDGKRETAEGKLLIDAAKAAGVRGIIWSGLPSVAESSGGKYTHVGHFDCKAAVSAYGRQSGVPFAVVQAGWYGTNIFELLVRQHDGTFTLPRPIRPPTEFPFIDTARDYGVFVRYVLERDVFPDGEEMLAHGENISIQDITRQLSEVTGRTIIFKQVSAEEWKSHLESKGLPPHVVIDLVEGSLWGDEYGWNGPAPLESLARRPRTFMEFAKEADWSSLA